LKKLKKLKWPIEKKEAYQPNIEAIVVAMQFGRVRCRTRVTTCSKQHKDDEKLLQIEKKN
jgi:hypothetical protein